MAANYVDVYLLPVPEDNMDAYVRQATAFGAIAKELGAISYREFRNDDPGEGMGAGDGEVMTTAIVEFESRGHRDDVMSKVMEDPRVKEQMKGDDPADMSKMRYGGFELLVDP